MKTSVVVPPPRQSFQRPDGKSYTAADLDLIRRTVAKDCHPAEFDLFMAMARRKGLDPLIKEIYAMITNAKNPEKRSLVLMVAIDGQRTLAYRATKDRGVECRPDENEAVYELDEALISKTNPKGLIKATVTWYVSDKRGDWHPFKGSARWDEYVPLYWNKTTGEHEIQYGKMWDRMPYLMLAKVAEAQALRRIAPESLGGVYAPEELHQAQASELSDWERAEGAEEAKKLALIGAKDTIPTLLPGDHVVQRIPIDQFADRMLDHMRKFEHAGDLLAFMDSNSEGLREFWIKRKSDGLELKRERDKLLESLRTSETAAEIPKGDLISE